MKSENNIFTNKRYIDRYKYLKSIFEALFYRWFIDNLPLYIMVGSSSAGEAADFVTNRLLYSSIISFTSSSGTFSLLFIICTNLLSDIRPVFWGSKDLRRENNFLHVYFAKRGKYVWRYHVSIYPIFGQHMLNICILHITWRCPANSLRLAPLFFAGK